MVQEEKNKAIKQANIAIIVPLYNEIAVLPTLLNHLQKLVSDADISIECIAVDGGSDDQSWQWLQQHWHQPERFFYALQSSKGRATQMNHGAAFTSANTLLFLHADTQLNKIALSDLIHTKSQFIWGRFNIRFTESDWCMNVIAFFINLRSKLSGVATGDQAIFVTKQSFDKVQGFPNIAIMEDVALSKRLRKLGKPYCSKQTVQTSARRWLNKGVVKTVLMMWYFRLAYFLGVSPQKLAKQYQDIR